MVDKLDLHDIRSELEKQRDQLVKNIENMQQKRMGSDASNPGPDDLAQSYMSAEIRAIELTRMEEKLTQVKEAIDRMDKGAYGKCTRCGNMISPDRLRALPYAAMCIQCQQETS